MQCRGYEHETTLTWSITSGKRLIIDDSKEVHYSIGRRAEGKFQHSWTGSNNHVFTIVAYASPPLSARPGFKQFELFIDGMSFDSLPRIFELGTTNVNSRNRVSSARDFRSVPSPSYSEHRSDRESPRQSPSSHYGREMQWAQAVHAIESERNMNHQERTSAAVVGAVDTTDNVQPVQDLLSSPTVSLLDMENPSPIMSSTSTDSGSFWDHQQPDPYSCSPNQPPSYEAVWSSIMDAYDTNNNPADIPITTTVTTTEHSTTMPVMSSLQINTSSSSNDYPSKHQFDQSSSMDSPRDISDMDGVLKNLVNLDDISSNGMKGYSKESFEKEQKEKSRTKSLRELKSMQPSPTSIQSSKREIMKTHAPIVTNPGALVVYGQPQQQQGYNNYCYNAPVMYSSY